MGKILKIAVIPVIVLSFISISGCGRNQEKGYSIEAVEPSDIDEEMLAEGGDSKQNDDSQQNDKSQENTDAQENTIQIDIEEEYFNLNAEDGTQLCTQDEDWAVVTIPGNQTASDTINAFFENQRKNYRNTCMEYGEAAQEEYQLSENEGEGYYSGYSIVNTLTRERADENVISFTDDYSEYTGGAHPNSSRSALNFSTKTGKRLTLSDITEDESGLREYINQFISKKLEAKAQEGLLFEDYKDYIDQILGEDTWLLSQRGLVIICNEYLIAPHAAGIFEFDIPYEDLEKYLKKEYVPVTKAKAYNFSMNEPFYEDIDQDGEKEELELSTRELEDNGGSEIYLSINGVSEKLGESYGYYYRSCFIMKEYGSCAVLFDGDMASDDFTSYMYRFDGKKAARMAVLEAAFNYNTLTPDSCDFTFAVNVLGTWGGVKKYTITENFALIPEENEYTLRNGGKYGEAVGLTTTQDLEVTDENGENQTILPAGSLIYPRKTDGISYLLYDTKAGVYQKIYFEKKDSTLYIGDISEYDLFEMLPYAG